MRIYLSATVPMLLEWLEAGEVPVQVSEVYAVTPTLRESYREADLDELEHTASLDAAVGSLRLLAADASAPRRRVVLAAEVDDAVVRPAPPRGRTVVTVGAVVPVARWASSLIDDPGLDAVVNAAIASLDAAARGDDDAQFALDEAEAHELGWYAVQELRYLLD
jgi:hypothetical protein